MPSGPEQLRTMIARLESVGELATSVAVDVADAVDREIKSSLARGTAPDGKPWKRTKDGRRALQNAQKAVRVQGVADTVVVTVDGHHARHHLGAVKGGTRRQVIPTRRVPDSVLKGIDHVITGEFKRITGAR